MLFAACLTAIALSAAGMNVAETGGAIKLVFSETGTSSDASTKLTAIEDILESGSDYVTLTTATEVYKGRTGRGNKLGGSSKAYELVMTLKNPVKPTSIVINAMPYQNDKDKANNKMVFMGDTIVLAETGALADYTIAYDGKTEVSAISLKAVQDANNRIYVTSITINAGESAAPELKTVATVEKLWSKTVAEIGVTAADSRQGAGYNGAIYILNKANHSLVAITENAKDTIINGNIVVGTDTIKLDGTAYALDDAGNFVMEGTFPNKPSHLVVRKADGSEVDDLAIEGLARTDFINATGDVFSEDGGHVFVYGNSATGLLVYKIAKGAIVNTTTVSVAGASGGNYVIAGNDTKQIAHHRTSENGWVLIDNGVATTIENMEGFKKTTLGGDIITLAGKEFYIYPAGTTNYNSEFSIRNMTDGVMVVDKTDAAKTIFFANDVTKQPGSTSTANWLIATPIDANNAYIHLYNAADGVALFKLSVSVAAELVISCDETQGTVTGGGDIAVGANATVVATPKPGYEFVAWKKGETTVSTDPTYTFAVNENTALTAVFEAKANVTITLAVNDATLGSITLPEGIVMGENSVVYGTPVALVAVPAEGVSFLGWFKGEELYSSDLNISLTGKESISLSANFAKALVLSYELNGGVTNDYGWTSKAHMALLLQEDYNTAYSATKAWAKEENGVIYYYVGGEWQLPSDVQGKAADVSGFIQSVTYNTSDNLVNLLHNDKWLLLMNYIDTLRVKAGNAVADEGALRADVSGFFLCSPAITDYRHTNDYTTAGTEEAFLSANKIGFANPTEIKTGVTLNAPYKEGSTFDGWYATADFSGDKITYVDPETVIPGGKLYAKWIEYIPTIAEIYDMEVGVETRAKGTVTYVAGSNFWIQDITGGILCYQKDLGLAVGDVVTLKAKTATFNNYPELTNITVENKEAGAELTPEVATISQVTAEPAKYMYKLVKFVGIRVAGYTEDSYANPIFTDGDNTIVGRYGLKAETTPANTRVNLKTVVSCDSKGLQLRGEDSWVEEVGGAGVDPYQYPARMAEGDFAGYTLENDWLYSINLDNYGDNVPGVDGAMLRSMVEKDGKMYFLNRTSDGAGYFVVVDGKTGVMEPNRLNITGDHLFQKKTVNAETGAEEWSSAVLLPFNHVTKDSEGNILVGPCIAGAHNMMIYIVDEKTGAATELINEAIWDNADMDSIVYRLDAFGAWGDVKSHAVIIASVASYTANAVTSGLNAFRWEINNGVAEMAELVEITASETDDFKTYLVNAEGKPLANAGISPTALPLDEEYFLIDGQATYPTLISRDGDVVDDFKNNHAGILKVGNNVGDTCTLQVNNNGLAQFQVGGDYFFLMAATCYTGVPKNVYALYKFKDASQSFAEMEPLWFFPNAGLGDGKGSSFQATPYVEIDGTEAKIYIYQPAAGYGVYTFTGKVGTGIENIIDASYDKVQKVLENGVIYIYRNGVKYNTMGAQVK